MFPALLPTQTSHYFATSPPQSLTQTQSRSQYSAFYTFTPQTPSPLRTSRNVNLMPPKTSESIEFSPSLNKDSAIVNVDENAVSIAYTRTPSAKLAQESQTSPSSFYITPPNTCFNFKSSRPADYQQQGPKLSSFESRARSASPAAALSKRAQDSRNEKKNKFLDRIRQRRDDERRGGSVYGEQVLRMDFMRERRAWEEEMARRALYNADVDIDHFSYDQQDMEVDDQNIYLQQHQEGMSPPDDTEIEELVAYLENGHSSEYHVGQQSQHGFEGISDDDEDYDQLFMEVINSRSGNGDGNVDLSVSRPPQEGAFAVPDGSQMDMS